MPISVIGASGLPSGNAVLQVQHTQITARLLFSTVAGVDRAINQLTVNITPISSSSIIHIQAHIFCEIGTDNNNSFNHTFFFFRDATKLAPIASGNRNVGISMATRTFNDTDDNSTPQIARYDYFDTPATTSQIAYKCGVRTRADDSITVNKTIGDADEDYSERGISFISATEIAG
tara:strand:+ start:995 stop:1522 length:528 start_codon:yes stop_codon:yes gene_type:complete